MPNLRHANTMPTHADKMEKTGWNPSVLCIVKACVGIVLACLGLGICWLLLAYEIYYICCLAFSDPGFVVGQFSFDYVERIHSVYSIYIYI